MSFRQIRHVPHETRFHAAGIGIDRHRSEASLLPGIHPDRHIQPVGAMVRRYRIESADRLIVLQDELDLPPGDLRIKNGGGLAGHNGLRSITQHLKTQDYLRVRIGVGKPPSKDVGKGHVLSRVPRRERELLDVAVVEAADAAELIVDEGVDAAMQRFNVKR